MGTNDNYMEENNMGVFQKLKHTVDAFFTVDSEEPELAEENEQSASQPIVEEHAAEQPKSRTKEKAEKKSNVVSFENSRSSFKNVGDSQVIVKKVVSVDEVGAVADILKDNRIVVLNLEDCPADTVQRIIDILYGVSYALDGTFSPIADRAFVITPRNVSVQGEDMNDTESYE